MRKRGRWARRREHRGWLDNAIRPELSAVWGAEAIPLAVESGRGGTWLHLESFTDSGLLTTIEFRRRFDLIEIWHLQYCRAIFQLERLRAWLGSPQGSLGIDDVTLSVSRAGNRNELITLRVPTVRPLTLTPAHVYRLNKLLGG
jgi:hypothetical protein